ncbi:MAG TPA: nicotinate phosphoribosyltransferase, partial [Candidatus Binataceae bacterium]|nr:nicotinate phosphoribosyltransferase [Candidatus Binataceae bacterium]
NQIGMASLFASKAARSVIAARGRRLVDFGLRRSQGQDGGLIAARSSYLAGFDGTSNVLAGRRYGIPVFGTMAHSYIMVHDREREAFEHFVQHFPKQSTLLVDTYDTIHGVENAVAVALEMKQRGDHLQAVRLDSGDLAELSVKAREILDRNGLKDTSIFASGNLNEIKIDQLIRADAPIDAFGVGTEMVVSADAPALDVAYKLSEYDGRPRLKTSEGKLTLPGRKQIFRAIDELGGFYADIVGLADEDATAIAREFQRGAFKVAPLLSMHLKDGHRLTPRPTLAELREHFLQVLAKLDPRYKELEQPENYPVKLSAALDAMLSSEKMRAAKRQE